MSGDRRELHYGEPSMTYKLAESLCCTPESDVTLCVNHIQINKIVTSLFMTRTISKVLA